jgi:hypothetical protein
MSGSPRRASAICICFAVIMTLSDEYQILFYRMSPLKFLTQHNKAKIGIDPIDDASNITRRYAEQNRGPG